MYLGQSAIEYLMTYGWMLLVVAVAGGAVFSVAQDSSMDSINGFSGGDVLIDDFGVTSSDELGLELRSGSGTGITVSQVNVSDSSTGNWVYKEFTGENRVGVGSSRIFELPNVSRTDSGNELEVEVVYDSGGLSNMSVSGTISGNLELTDTGIYEGLPEDDHQLISDEDSEDSDVTVVMEAWGAQGGGSNAGLGGYSYAEREMTEGEKLYMYVGESPGDSSTNSEGGWNGGGDIENGNDAFPGGGASDVRIEEIDNQDITESNDPRLLVAGGGGGDGFDGPGGGAGGDLQGEIGEQENSQPGEGGTQDQGGAGGWSGGEGSILFGGIGEYGTGSSPGGAGGGGYYGGGGGEEYSTAPGPSAGGGGGSGFVDDPENVNTEMSTGVNEGHGMVNITINGDTTSFVFDEGSDPEVVQPYVCEVSSSGCVE